MILRNAILSEERYRLNADATPVTPNITDEPAPKPLILEEVCAWLLEQGDGERATCAAILAPELKELRSQARAEGYAEGHATAMHEVNNQHVAALAALTEMARVIGAAGERADSELADACAAIVAEAFAKLAGDALVTPAAALGSVQSILARMRAAGSYTVYVHPSDLVALEVHRDDLQAALGSAPLNLQSDSALSSGGCRVESELETLDAAFDRQLTSLLGTLRAAHESRVVRT
jgi:flagellar assembly protein FliH